MIDPVAIQIGPFAIHWYALCIMTGLVLAVYLSSKEAPRKKMTSDDVIDFIIIAFPIAIIGARLYYVIFEWSYYSKHLNELLAIWNGGIAIYGGLITGAIVLFIYCYYKVLNPIRFLDIIAPGVMLAQAIGGGILLIRKLMAELLKHCLIYQVLFKNKCLLMVIIVCQPFYSNLSGISLVLLSFVILDVRRNFY